MSHVTSGWEYIDGCANKENRQSRSIRRIIIKGAVDVFFRRTVNASLVIAGDTPEAISSLKTTFDGDTLVIEREGMNISFNNGSVVINSNVSMVAGRNIKIQSDTGTMTFKGGVGTVYLGDVDIVDGKSMGSGVIVGNGKVVVGLMLPESPSIEIRGSGNVNLQDVKQNRLELELAGSGDITVQGEVKRHNVDIVGSGDVDARDLTAEEAELRVAGSGDIETIVCAQVRARVAGSGDIVVYGNPAQRNHSVTDSGKIIFR